MCDRTIENAFEDPRTYTFRYDYSLCHAYGLLGHTVVEYIENVYSSTVLGISSESERKQYNLQYCTTCSIAASSTS